MFQIFHRWFIFGTAYIYPIFAGGSKTIGALGPPGTYQVVCKFSRMWKGRWGVCVKVTCVIVQVKELLHGLCFSKIKLNQCST